MRRNLTLVAVAALTAGALAACEPAPPRLQLVVDSAADGADDDPGDGACSSSAAGGACTLRAAVEEGNAVSTGADIAVPSGDYLISAQVTGNLSISAEGAATPNIDGTLVVFDGGFLALEGINTSTEEPTLALLVYGSASLDRTWTAYLSIGEGGAAVTRSSVLGTASNGPGVVNSGTLLAVSTSIIDEMNGAAVTAPLVTNPEGNTTLAGSVVARPELYLWGSPAADAGMSGCDGKAPVSTGYVHIEIPCGGEPAIGDSSGDAGLFVDVEVWGRPQDFEFWYWAHGVTGTSPLIDAIPLGAPGCGPGDTDLYGNPRGVDGDGDGVDGCDIGAVELQP